MEPTEVPVADRSVSSFNVPFNAASNFAEPPKFAPVIASPNFPTVSGRGG
jgi:hypothetical protein